MFKFIFDRYIPGERTPVTMSWKLFGPKENSGRFRKEKTVLSLRGIEPQIIQPVAKSLYSLKYLFISGP